jgi:hypothetical protein
VLDARSPTAGERAVISYLNRKDVVETMRPVFGRSHLRPNVLRGARVTGQNVVDVVGVV